MNKYVKIYIGIGVAIALYDLYLYYKDTGADHGLGVSGTAINFAETVAVWPYYVLTARNVIDQQVTPVTTPPVIVPS